MDKGNERDVDPITEMTRIAQDLLHVELWGFRESYHSFKPAEIIYDSECCRVCLTWKGWDYELGNTIHISYGRLHAHNEETVMQWQGEACNCWHDLRNYLLYFLDGRTPVDAVKLGHTHPVTAPYYQGNMKLKFNRREPEWLAQLHLAVWQHYGQTFFDLFDLRKPELWKEYQQFLKQIYDTKGRIPEIVPALDKVC